MMKQTLLALSGPVLMLVGCMVVVVAGVTVAADVVRPGAPSVAASLAPGAYAALGETTGETAL